jgi:hypothetical protein
MPGMPQQLGVRPSMPFGPAGLPMPGLVPGMPPIGLPMGAAPPGSPKRSNSGVSHAFDALVMAATGGTEGAAAAAAGGEPQVESVAGRGGGAAAGAGNPTTAIAAAVAAGALAAAAVAAAAGGAAAAAALPAAAAAAAAARAHALPAKQRSRLFGGAGAALSYGDADSLQNALDAFRAEEEIASGLGLSDATMAAAANAAAGGTAESFRRRQRKPMRGPSSSMLGAAPGDSLLGSLLKAGVSGLKEKSADNGGEVSSGAEAGGAGGGGEGGGGDGVVGGGLPEPGAVSEEDDSQPEKQQQQAAAAARNRQLAAAVAAAAAGVVGGGADDGGAGAGADPGPPPGGPGADFHGGRRVRHVPRQSSAINLGTRVGPAELKRLAAEVETLRTDNLRLSNALRGNGLDPAAAGSVSDVRLRMLEDQLLSLQEQVAELERGKAAAEEEAARLRGELAAARQGGGGSGGAANGHAAGVKRELEEGAAGDGEGPAAKRRLQGEEPLSSDD